jgi:hypothetical protein
VLRSGYPRLIADSVAEYPGSPSVTTAYAPLFAVSACAEYRNFSAEASTPGRAAQTRGDAHHTRSFDLLCIRARPLDRHPERDHAEQTRAPPIAARRIYHRGCGTAGFFAPTGDRSFGLPLIAHWCTFMIEVVKVTSIARFRRPGGESQRRLPQDGPHETCSPIRRGRTQPTTGCCAQAA